MSNKIDEAEEMLMKARQLEYNANRLLDEVCRDYKSLSRSDMWKLMQRLPQGVHQNVVYSHYSSIYGRPKDEPMPN